jgi:AcrR family transcriptional regulator
VVTAAATCPGKLAGVLSQVRRSVGGASAVTTTEASPRSADTRMQMMEAAERLIALRGADAVSIREIGAAAGQRNKMALQYHFGSKDELIHAVLVWRREPINARRESMLAAVTATTPSELIPEALRCEILPLAELLDDDTSYFLRFMANHYRANRDPLWWQHELSAGGSASSAAQGLRLIRQALAEIDDEAFTIRSALAATLIFEALARREADEQDHSEHPDRARFIEELIEAASALFLRSSSTPSPDKSRRSD